MKAVELTPKNFDREVLQSAVPVLVDFGSPSCGPCRQMLPLVDQLAVEGQGRFRVAKVDVGEHHELAARYQVDRIPTLLIFRGGAVAETLLGVQPRHRLLAALGVEEFAATG